MSFIVYFFVALIAACSVLFGLDVVSAPMSPMPASKYELRAAVPPVAMAKVESALTPKDIIPKDMTPKDLTPKTESGTSAVAATSPALGTAPSSAAGAAQVKPAEPPTALDQQPPSIAAAEPGTVAAAPASAPRCDLDACAAAYRTFDAADCTYKPSEGPRRLCTKGTPPAVPVAAASPPAPDARAQACNVAACSQSYPRSFSAADCTFQPSQGPRRVCTK